MVGIHGNRQAGRQAGRRGSGSVAESFHLLHKQQAERGASRGATEPGMAVGNLKPTSSNTPLQTRPHLIVLPKQLHQQGTKRLNI